MFLNKEIKLQPRQLKKIINDDEASAAAIKLRYISDSEKGISRKKDGKDFSYYFKGKKITDKKILDRIELLVIPPAWTNVWISPFAEGHLQATGLDAANRKQYLYHQRWVKLRHETKFFRMLEFGKALPVMREKLEQDLALRGLPKRKVLAAVVRIMDRTGIRVGNNLYEKLYGSFGLSTMKDRHVKIDGKKVRFVFRGKKGVEHDVSLKSKRLAKIIKNCRDIPGKELFQYFDEDGERRVIESGHVNDYIREISGGDFTSKDFRTWAGTVQCILAFNEIGWGSTITATRKNVVAAIDKVAQALGNTRSVCKKHYIHPLIISAYQNHDLEKALAKLQRKNETSDALELSEKILLSFLEKEKGTVVIT